MKISFLNPHENRDEMQKIWLSLQEKSSHSFFTSWGWMDSWLLQMPSDVNLSLIYGTCGSDSHFCFLMSERRSIRHRLFLKNRAFLNTTGDSDLDSLTIEYNGVLSAPDEKSLLGLFARSEFEHIEEFHFPGMATSNVMSFFDESFVVATSTNQRSYYVDLDGVRAGSHQYLSRLSANRRSQIRKSIKVAEKFGEVELREAASSREALHMLDALISFHQAEWQSRGEAGAFSSTFFCAFHKDLIARRFGAGEIQMLEVTAGEVAIGYLYNFVYNGDVLFYQSGFNYAAARNCRPGLLSHYRAILHNLERGHSKYNFLAGGAQYKKSLSTDFDTLFWSVVTRKNLKSRLENLLRGAKRRLR